MLKLVKPMRTLTAVSLGLVVLIAIGMSGIVGCFGDDEIELFIVSDGGRCTIADADGNNRIEVKQGQWIIFNNETSTDVELDLSPNLRLFGVVKLISYRGGSKLKLMVFPDAATGEHPIRTNCGTTDPPPVIIVNPPGGGGGG